jgi:DNA-binding MarR family transcriptional regulator
MAPQTKPEVERTERRRELLEQLTTAGRDLSDAIVLFHATIADRLGIGSSDWKTMGLLKRHGPMTAGELVKRTSLAPASVTGILGRLERRGWIHRRRDDADARRVVVELDPSAGRETAVLFAGLIGRLDKLYGQYTDEELRFLVDALGSMASLQREATAELHDLDIERHAGGADKVSKE